MAPRSPDRSSMQMPGATFGYPTPSRDYGYYGPGSAKRQRTSIDFGNRSIYDTEGRIRQVDAYPQTAAMYSNPPGAYQTPMMQGYSTGHAGVPDYAVRPPAPAAAMTPSSYGSPEESMLGVRSPGPGYVTQARYPTYNEAQIPYGLSSTQVPSIPDPGAQGRPSQQATMQTMGMVNQPGTPVWTSSANPMIPIHKQS